MPDVSGFEVARQVRRQDRLKQCFIIAVTGRTDAHASQPVLRGRRGLVFDETGRACTYANAAELGIGACEAIRNAYATIGQQLAANSLRRIRCVPARCVATMAREQIGVPHVSSTQGRVSESVVIAATDDSARTGPRDGGRGLRWKSEIGFPGGQRRGHSSRGGVGASLRANGRRSSRRPLEAKVWCRIPTKRQ